MQLALEHVATVVDVTGLLILVVGAVKFVARYVSFELNRLRGSECAERIRQMRLELGSYILLSLEFMIVSDIIHSALTHTREDLLNLGLLVVVRTAIGFFLGQELKEVQTEESMRGSTAPLP